MQTTVDKDAVAHTMTVTTELGATVERAWQLWADPRQLERWWGPPTYPATVVEHELAPAATVRYFMTSPDGDKYHGFWRSSPSTRRTGSSSWTASPTTAAPRTSPCLAPP